MLMLALGLAVLLAGAGSQDPAAEEGLKIEAMARSMQPGEVVILLVSLPGADLSRVQASAFGETVRFFRSQGRSQWSALLGIDLTTKPGSYPVRISAWTEGAERPLEGVHRIRVDSKEFPVRRLTVDSKFVDPPAETLKRIRRESKLVNGVLSQRTPNRLWKGEFLRPVKGAATSSFGKRSILNGKPRSPHSGTDFRAKTGEPILAPNAGRVVLARDLYFAGKSVIIDHGQGLFSYFAHLSEFRVEEGSRVSPGEVVGLVGATGRVTGAHLHWSARINGARVDPLSLMEILSEFGEEGASLQADSPSDP